MFRRRKPVAKVHTIIGIGTELNGNIQFSGGLHIDGTVRGNVEAEEGDGGATVILSENGAIEGDVKAAHVVLNGSVVGDVVATEKVELAPDAKITGTVYYKALEMALGAEVNGKLVHTEEEHAPKMLSYDRADAEPAATPERSTSNS